MTDQARPANPLLEVGITIVVPALILMRASGPDQLGPALGLVVALSFPIAWGLFEAVRSKRTSWLALLGVVSTLLTGGIGLLELDNRWLAIKEAAIPGLIGLAILVSSWTRYPLIRAIIFNARVLDVDRIHAALEQTGVRLEFERTLILATRLLAGTFFFSSAMNYLMATWIVRSPAGTEAFNTELGRLTLLSYPMIALPSMAMLIGILFWLMHQIKRRTGLGLTELLRSES